MWFLARLSLDQGASEVYMFEFLRHNECFKCPILSIDVEGGFDHFDLDLLCDFLAARRCPTNLVL